jgi:hypothetical protein
MTFIGKILIGLIDLIVRFINFLSVLGSKIFDIVRHLWEKFAFSFLKTSYIIYGNKKTETKLYKDDLNIIHTIETYKTVDMTSGNNVDITIQ